MARSKSELVFMDCRLTSWITSPRCSPEPAARLDGLIPVTTTPLVFGGNPSCRAVCVSMSSTDTPERELLEPLRSFSRLASFTGSSPKFTVISRSVPFRSTFRRTLVSGCIIETVMRNWLLSATGLPSSSTMISPRSRPLFCAGLLGLTSLTRAPSGSFTPNALAMAGVTSCGMTPRYARVTFPFFRISSITVRQVHRNREADALITFRSVGDNGGIDPYQFTAVVDQRPTRVAGVDGRVGLNEVFVIFDSQVRPAVSGAHDAHRHGLANAEGVANGKRIIADLDLRGIADDDRWQVRGVDFQYRDISLCVGADQPRFELALVGEGDADITGSIDDVMIGQNVA